MTRLCKVLCASLLALFIALPDASAADYDGLIGQARAHLEGGRVVDALAASNEAVKLNPADFKGHYYGAMALMSLGRFDDSEAAAAQALTLAPEAGRPAVAKLRDAVKARKDGDAAEQAASSALAEGLFGKAAPAYERAWLAGRTRPEFGLKAADLYANRLKSPIDAGRVLRQVITAVPGRPEVEVAQSELTKIAPALRGIAQEHVSAARDSSGDEALRRLALAEAADPDFADIYVQRAKVYAASMAVPGLLDAVKQLARLDEVKLDVLAELPNMGQLAYQPDTATAFEGYIGQAQLADLKIEIEKAEQRRLAKKKKIEEEAREMERRTQEEAREKERRTQEERDRAERKAQAEQEKRELEEYHNRWAVGAIARGGDGVNYAASQKTWTFLKFDKTTSDAKSAALKACEDKGMGYCNIIITFRQCGAAAVYGLFDAGGTGETKDDAEENAINRCGRMCKAAISGCTPRYRKD